MTMTDTSKTLEAQKQEITPTEDTERTRECPCFVPRADIYEVDDQIVIIDESVSNQSLSMVERIKRAFFIIVGAFFTIIAAMLPLFWAGAGMLKGFALTTILCVMIGILVTRPAFAEILKKIQE
jgi:hypothetical protein